MKRSRYTIQIATNRKQLYEWEEGRRHDKIRLKWLSCLKNTILTNSVQLDSTTVRNLITPIDRELEILNEDLKIETDFISFYKETFEYSSPLG